MPVIAGTQRHLYVMDVKKETTFGTDVATGAAAADFHEFRVNSESLNLVLDIQDDLDIIGGEEEVTEAEVLAKRVEGSMDQPRAKPNTVAVLCGFSLGTCSTSSDASNGRVHTFTPIQNYSTNGLDIPSFSAVEDYRSFYQRWFTGLLVDSFTLTGDRKGYLQLSSTIMGSGRVFTWSTDLSGQAEVASEPWLKMGYCKVWMHVATNVGTYDGALAQSKATDDLTGTTSAIEGRTRSFSWTYNNNISMDDLYRFNGGLVATAGERTRRSQTLSFVVEADGSTSTDFLDRLENQTQGGAELELYSTGDAIASGTTYYGVNIIFPLLQFETVSITGGPGDKIVINLDCKVMQSSSTDSVVLAVHNAVSDYLQ